MEGTSASPTAVTTPPPSPDASPRPKQLKPYDEQTLRQLVIQCDWIGVHEELLQILPVQKKGQNLAKVHPDLFLPVYTEWVADLLRNNDPSGAFKIFVDKVASIYEARGEFVVDQEKLKNQVSHLHHLANERVELTSAPTAAEKVCTTLTDYLDLYFPLLTGHNMACEGYLHLWYFAKRMDKPEKQKDPNFRCLACGAVFKNCTISKMRNHLNIEAGGKICEKLTQNMFRRFKDGESSKNSSQNQKDQLEGDHGESVGPSKQVKKGGRAKENLSVAESTKNIGSLADAVCTSIQILHAASVGKILDPEVEARLKEAKDLLNEIVP